MTARRGCRPAGRGRSRRDRGRSGQGRGRSRPRRQSRARLPRRPWRTGHHRIGRSARPSSAARCRAAADRRRNGRVRRDVRATTARRSSGARMRPGTSARCRYRMSSATIEHALAGEPGADAHRERAQASLGHPVDPVVVDLGQRPDLAAEREEPLELGQSFRVVGQRPPDPFGQSIGLAHEPRRPLHGRLGSLVQAPRHVGKDHRRLLGPRRLAEVVESLAKVAVQTQEGFELREEGRSTGQRRDGVDIGQRRGPDGRGEIRRSSRKVGQPTQPRCRRPRGRRGRPGPAGLPRQAERPGRPTRRSRRGHRGSGTGP